ncbi:MAG: cell division protein FtsA [Blastocatellia bacterium]
MARQNSPIVGLDIGTSSVRVVIAEAFDGQLEIVGIGDADSKGLRRGVISKPDLTVDAIKRAVDDAEMMSGLTINQVYVGLAGSSVKGENSNGMIAITGRHRAITHEDVMRVIDTACAISIPSGREVADVLPQEYTVDDQDGIDDPFGMLGSRLSVSVHIITSPVAAKQNIISSVNRAGLNVAGIYLTQLAAAEAVLTDDDREYGVALVNIGGETTSLAIYQRGSVWHTAVFPVGGNHFTNDIAIGLKTPIPEAERIKREYGCAHRALLDRNQASELIEVPSVGGRAPRAVSRQILCDILEPRAEEILSLVQEEIRKEGYDRQLSSGKEGHDRQLSSGVVLTGGGAMLNGLIEVAEGVFDAPVRLGVPGDLQGLGDEIASPNFAAAVGLILYGSQRELGLNASARGQWRRPASKPLGERVKSFFGIRR